MTSSVNSLHRSLHGGTPTVSINDNRGLAIRQVRYHRHPDTPTVTDPRITRHQFDPRGQLVCSIDPRLHERQQTQPGIAPNFSYHPSLAGQALRTDSVDAGTTYTLGDIDGRPLSRVGASGVLRRWLYEQAPLAGRLTAQEQQAPGATAQVTERLLYGDNSAVARGRNLAGVCTSHFDTAGLTETLSIGLAGAVLEQGRTLLQPGREAHWQGDDISAWQAQLAVPRFTTQSLTDATGALILQHDAQGHAQRMAYDLAGRLCGSWLTLKNGVEQVILQSATYSASGQALREQQGNGVVTTYSYDPRTTRLARIHVQRPAGHASGARVLQDLRYRYDPVGNVLGVHNDAEATRFWRNRKVVPENLYVYDSLYQLVAASGREMAALANSIGKRPPALQLPANDNSLTPYARTYHYDRADNLTRIVHAATASGASHSVTMTVSQRSNRAVPANLSEDPDAVDGFFDAAGNLRQLQPGQALAWTPRDELQQVALVSRSGPDGDHEIYRYDASGQRVEKTARRLAANSTLHQQVVYLPGLEVRTWLNDDTVQQALHVVTLAAAGRAQVRVLYWESGLPEGLDNGAPRYSYGDLIDSSGLELDAQGQVISQEEYYPFGGTSVWQARSEVEAAYKSVRYAGKEQDASGLYYYGFRYYQPWSGRWLSADPAGALDGLNLYRMVHNNPVTLSDGAGLDTQNQYDRDYRLAKKATKAMHKAGESVIEFVMQRDKVIRRAVQERLAKEGVLMAVGTAAGLGGAEAGVMLGGALGTMATPVVGTIVGGFIGAAVGYLTGAAISAGAASVVGGLIPDSKLKPDTDIRTQTIAEARRKRDKTKDFVKAQFGAGNIAPATFDTVVTEGVNLTLNLALSVSNPLPLPITAMSNLIEDLRNARLTEDDEIIAQLGTAIQDMRQMLQDLGNDVNGGFNTPSLPPNGQGNNALEDASDKQKGKSRKDFNKQYTKAWDKLKSLHTLHLYLAKQSAVAAKQKAA
ncbi:RHS repeat-associated core domain-containing protein [Pseudomonas xanthosomatis]|uniref:RHS repeat-associated core domain-containing protein n=1 Tax=Pseudomonas xanthosomatis TaxID=2842356 RepID=UPI003518849E